MKDVLKSDPISADLVSELARRTSVDEEHPRLPIVLLDVDRGDLPD